MNGAAQSRLEKLASSLREKRNFGNGYVLEDSSPESSFPVTNVRQKNGPRSLPGGGPDFSRVVLSSVASESEKMAGNSFARKIPKPAIKLPHIQSALAKNSPPVDYSPRHNIRTGISSDVRWADSQPLQDREAAQSRRCSGEEADLSETENRRWVPVQHSDERKPTQRVVFNSGHAVDAFLAGIASTLKSLDPVLLNDVKTKIFGYVQEAEREQLQMVNGAWTARTED